MKKIKNNDTVLHTWCGQGVEPGEYYEIQPLEETIWANDSTLLVDIANSIALVNDGDSDLTDVNQAINFLKNHLPSEVVTQFEKNDKTIKVCSGSAEIDQDGEATISFRVPGSMASGDGRYVDGGKGWFSEQHLDDKVVAIQVVDQDNVLGYGAGTVLRSYSDAEMGTQEGWFVPKCSDGLDLETLGGYGFLPAELYLVVRGKKGESQTSGKFYVNIKWGKSE